MEQSWLLHSEKKIQNKQEIKRMLFNWMKQKKRSFNLLCVLDLTKGEKSQSKCIQRQFSLLSRGLSESWNPAEAWEVPPIVKVMHTDSFVYQIVIIGFHIAEGFFFFFFLSVSYHQLQSQRKIHLLLSAFLLSNDLYFQNSQLK